MLNTKLEEWELVDAWDDDEAGYYSEWRWQTGDIRAEVPIEPNKDKAEVLFKEVLQSFHQTNMAEVSLLEVKETCAAYSNGEYRETNGCHKMYIIVARFHAVHEDVQFKLAFCNK